MRHIVNDLANIIRKHQETLPNIEEMDVDDKFREVYKETEDGIWYEVYVNDQIKKYYPKIDIKNNDEDKETFGKFSDIFFDHYEADNQITFFEANDEKEYTLDELTDILI